MTDHLHRWAIRWAVVYALGAWERCGRRLPPPRQTNRQPGTKGKEA